MNNIDTLIQTAPNKASEALSKLSDILRYVVYDTENEKVSLRKEIDNLNKYIDLEKLRLISPDSVTFTTEIIDDSLLVPPMLYFPFVENGFKHSNLNSKNNKLSISLSCDNKYLKFECVNTIFKKPSPDGYNGLGIELAKKRLELLFPDKHELTIQEEKNDFIVRLHINLKNE